MWPSLDIIEKITKQDMPQDTFVSHLTIMVQVYIVWKPSSSLQIAI